MTLKHCDLCGNTEFDVIARFDRRRNPLDTGMCTRCGLVCSMEIPSAEEEADYYAGRYRKEYNREETPSSRRVARAWRVGKHLLDFAPRLPPEASVFEIGAGLGCNVKRFELAGFRASGIEPGARWQQFSQQRLGAHVRRARIEDVEPEPVHDLVLLVHVIEHLRSPRDALMRIGRLLKPGGLLYVECPNLGAPFTKRRRLFHRAHLHNFTTSSMRMLTESCGYRVVEPQKDEREPNLSMLFQYTGEKRLEIDTDNGDRTLRAIARFDHGRYYLRPAYYWHRTRSICAYLKEFVTAPVESRLILARCRNGDPAGTIPAGSHS